MSQNKIGEFIKEFPDKKPIVQVKTYKLINNNKLKYCSYVLYNVKVTEMDWVCYRRYSDFLWLR